MDKPACYSTCTGGASGFNSPTVRTTPPRTTSRFGETGRWLVELYPSTSVLNPPKAMRSSSKGILGIGCPVISFMTFLFTAFRWAFDL